MSVVIRKNFSKDEVLQLEKVWREPYDEYIE